MSVDGFTPDPVRAPASDGFTPDAPVDNGGFTPDSTQAMATAGDKPKNAAADVGAQLEQYSAQAYESLGKSLKGIAGVLEPFSVPLRKFAGAVGKSIGMEVQDKPLSIWPGSAPDVTFTDVAEFLNEKRYPQMEMMKEIIAKGGTAEDAAKAVRDRGILMFGVGTIADFVLDPVNYITIFPVNKVTRTALQAGEDISKVERSTIGLTKPFSGKVVAELDIPLVNNAVDATKAPLKKMYSQLDWRSGDMEIDAGSVMFMNTKQSVPKIVSKEFADPYVKANMSPEEIRVMLNVAEDTPNLRPELAGLEGNQKVLRSGKVDLTPEEIQVLGKNSDELTTLVESKIRKAAEAEGVPIESIRPEVVQEMTMNIKRMNASALIEQQAARRLDLNRPLNEQLIENYVAHVKDPAVAKAMNKLGIDPETAVEEAAEELSKIAEKILEPTTPGLTNANRFGKKREIKKDVRSANESIRSNNMTMKGERNNKALKQAGTDAFFIENPYVASYMNLVKKKQAKLDEEFIDLLNTKGFSYVERDSYGNRVSKIEYDRSRFKDGTPEGKWAELTASKLGHFLTPTRSNITKKIEFYNKIFRNTALMKPSYYIQNFGDSLVKNAVQGVLPGDYVKAAKAWSGKGSVTVAGKNMSAAELRSVMEKANIVNFATGGEMVDAAMGMGKRATAEGVKFPGKKTFTTAFDKVRMMGASGENWSRAAMFVNRLERGYNVKQALYEVENFHFNFQRTTKAMDNLRLLVPFAQFPLKTIGVLGELTIRRPGIYNQQQLFMDRVDKAMNDPVESATLKKLLPEWEQINNPVPIGDVGKFLSGAGEFIDNMIGGNTWVARAALMYPKGESGLPSNQLYAKMPIGAEALNQWALWESSVAKNNGFLSGPLYQAAMTMLTGKNDFTGESYDANPEKPSYAERGKAAAYNFATGAFAFPNLTAMIKQEILGAARPENATPAAIRMFQGAMGGPNGFVQIYNVDRSYAIKKAIMKKQIDEQQKLMNSLYAKEVLAGKANTSWMSGVPTTTAREVFQDILAQRTDIVGTMEIVDRYQSTKRGPLLDKRTGRPFLNQELAKSVADMKGLIKENKEIDDNYVLVKNQLIEARKAEMKATKMTEEQFRAKYKYDQSEEVAAPENSQQPPQEAQAQDEEDQIDDSSADDESE